MTLIDLDTHSLTDTLQTNVHEMRRATGQSNKRNERPTSGTASPGSTHLTDYIFQTLLSLQY